jgi:hypothetical protein
MTACSTAPAARSTTPAGATTTAPGRKRTAWGNTWVVVGVLVELPFVAHRQVCLPVAARLWQPGGPSKLDLAGVLVGLLAARYPDRQLHLAGDAAYAGKTLRGCPPGSPSPPGCAATPPCMRCQGRAGPGSGAGRGSKANGSPS